MDNKVKVPSISKEIDVIDLATSSEDEANEKRSIKSNIQSDDTLKPNSVAVAKPIKENIANTITSYSSADSSNPNPAKKTKTSTSSSKIRIIKPSSTTSTPK